MKIDKKTKLGEIIKNEKAIEILRKYNLPCLSCPFSQMELEELEIGKVCDIYGLETKKVIQELNNVIKNEKRNN